MNLGDMAIKTVHSQTLVGTMTRPSFLLSGKVYQKLSMEDEIWLLRALAATIKAFPGDLEKSNELRFVPMFFALGILSLIYQKAAIWARPCPSFH